MTFSVTGDAPYGDAEVVEVQQQFDDHNLYSPSAFLVHVGDIFAGSDACSEFRYQRMADQLRTLAVPAFIVPGDNETVDCANPSQGWQYWEAHLLGIESDFCGVPTVERQSGREENFAFIHSGVLFMGIHLVGGSNPTSILQDNADWTEFQLQSKGGAVRAAVLFAQEGPEAGALFWSQFEADAAAFGKPVLVVHGDGHSWIHDNPFGQPNMTRVQIDRGDEPPVHITVTMDPVDPFEFERDPWPSGTPTYNTPVCVDAGSNRSIAGPGSIALGGIVKDDGLIFASPSAQWTALNPPGNVTFANASSPTSLVTFDAPGIYVLRLSANDGQYADSDELSVFVGDQPNAAPVATNDSYVTDEDVTLSPGPPGVLANDSDADGDALTVSVATWPSRGSLTLFANGSFVYTPNANEWGSDAFTYNVSDGRGGMDTGHVSITIFPVNDAPQAADDTYATGFQQPLDVGAPGVLLNDSDVEGDPLTAVLVTPPTNGSLVLAPDGSFQYTPDPDFAGWDTFTYAASDGAATGTPAVVTIPVGVTTFTPTDDATVRANQFKKNFGSEPTLELRATNKPYEVYLKFDVRRTEVVGTAKLRLYVVGAAASAGEVHVASNELSTASVAWREETVTWDNAPFMQPNTMSTGGAANAGSWVEFDVTEAVQNGVLSFGLKSSSTSLVGFSSKEGAHPPQLAVAWVPRGGPRQLPHDIAPSEAASGARAGAGANDQADKGLGASTEHDVRVSRIRRVYPNPARDGAWIEYDLSAPHRVRARVFNARGQRVRTLRSAEAAAGWGRMFWDGRDDQGHRLGTGVYFLQIDLGTRRYVRKILVER